MPFTAKRGLPRPRRDLSVRSTLAIVLVVTFVPVLAAFGYAVTAARSNAVGDARKASRSLAQVAAAGVGDLVLRSHGLMTELARSPLVTELRAGRCDPLLKAVPRIHPEYANIGLIDLSGRVHCSAVRQVGGAADVSASQWFRAVRRTGRFVVGDPFLGPITHRWVSVLALPLRVNGRVGAYLALPIDLVRYRTPFRELALGRTSVVGVFARNGVVVARLPDPARWVGGRLPDAPVAGARTLPRSGSYRGADGVVRLLGFAPVPGTTWTAYAGGTASAAFAASRRLALVVALAAGTSLVVAVLLALFLTQRIVRPIRGLADAARRVAGGDDSAAAPEGGPAEIAVAARQFNEMVTTRVSERRAAENLAARLAEAEKLEALGKLASGVAHDFNNLLTAIIGYDEHALSRDVDEDVRRDLVEIARASEIAAGITGQLLSFSRRKSAELRVIDLADAISRSARLVHRLLGEEIELELDLPPDPIFVRADRALVQQVLLNLAINARQAMPTGGTFSVRLTERTLTAPLTVGTGELGPGRYAELTTEDSGPGITEQDVPRIFEPFFTTKAVGQGTGLGLATAQTIVQEHGGLLWYEDGASGGACFRIVIPAVDPARGVRRSGDTAQRGPARVGAGERILLVEDEPVVRRVVELMLRDAGYAVVAPSDSREALAIVRGEDALPDAIVTDWTMPGLAAGEVARTARALHPRLPIVVISGNIGLETAEAAQVFDDFVQKPFAAEDIVHAVRRAIAKAGGSG